jgi:hypothetical protein
MHATCMTESSLAASRRRTAQAATLSQATYRRLKDSAGRQRLCRHSAPNNKQADCSGNATHAHAHECMQQQAHPSSKVVLQQPGLLAGAQRQAGSLHAIAHWRVQVATTGWHPSHIMTGSGLCTNTTAVSLALISSSSCLHPPKKNCTGNQGMCTGAATASHAAT